MGGTIGADETGAINCESNWQTLNCDVVNDLIVSALQKRRVDRSKRLESFCRQSCSECNRLLFANSNIKQSPRKRSAKNVETGSRWHGSRNSNDPIILLRLF